VMQEYTALDYVSCGELCGQWVALLNSCHLSLDEGECYLVWYTDNYVKRERKREREGKRVRQIASKEGLFSLE